MQTVWSISSRGIAISALALSLAACQSMRGPEPVVNTDIPESFASYGKSSGHQSLNRVTKTFLLTSVYCK